MNVPPELIQRTRQSWDTEDLALLFMEEEVGRHDWSKNWPKIKESGAAVRRIEEWLAAMQIEHDPNEIVAYLDRMVTDRAGSWI